LTKTVLLHNQFNAPSNKSLNSEEMILTSSCRSCC